MGCVCSDMSRDWYRLNETCLLKPGAYQLMRMPFRLELIVTVALCLAACAPEPRKETPSAEPGATVALSTDEEASQARPVIVMLGDSLTAGYQLPPEEALPEAIQAELDKRSVTGTIVNAGVSGDTTRGGLERYEWSVTGADADILLIALGANDYMSGMDVEVPKANLAALIERAEADGLMVGLIGISAPEAANIDRRDEAFDAIYPDLASQYGVPLYPNMMAGVFGHPEYLQPDGIHPTAEGVELIAADLATYVAALVEDWRAAEVDGESGQ